MSWSEADIPNQQGHLFVITGTGGLGYEAARAIASKGGTVVLAGRNAEKGDQAVARIRQQVPSADVEFELLDLASLASIKAFSDRMITSGRPIDVLVNNAGIAIVPERRTTADGFELQLGTNFLGHFALTLRLLPLLLRASAPRVVSLSSSTHKMGTIDLDDLQWQKNYSPSKAYGRSKLATLMFALELDRRARAAGVQLISNAAHPGIARTDLMSNGPTGQPVLQFVSHLIERLVGQSAAGGALPLLRAATDPSAKGGEYYGPSSFMEIKGPPVVVPPSPKAEDKVSNHQLWAKAEELTGLKLDFASNTLMKAACQ